MAYWHDIYRFRNSIEHELKWLGRQGAKGEKREKKIKPTPEQIARQNQMNKVTRTRRLIKANFGDKDLWCCLKYPAGIRPTVEEAKEDKKHFLGYLRKDYKKRGSPLKWIARLEVGAQGGIHFHTIVNRLWTAQTDILIADAWSRALKKSTALKGRYRTEGLVDWKTTYEAGGFQDLAEYICKEPEEDTEEYEQLSLFDETDQKALTSVSSSRNLIRPEPEHKYYRRRTMRKLVEEGPKPTPGYYIDRDSLHIGINPFTGYSYCRYTEVKIQQTRINPKSGGDLHPPEGGDAV